MATEVYVRRRAISSNTEKFIFEDGVTVQELVDRLELPPMMHEYLCVTIEGVEVLMPEWKRVRPKADKLVRVSVIPAGGGGGGKKILGVVAMLALAIAAPYAGAALATTFGFTSAAAAAVFSAGIMFVGAMLVNALFPPPKPPTSSGSTGDNADALQFMGMDGQRNSSRPYGAVREIFGQMRVSPDLAAEPYVITSGDVQTLYALYEFGYAHMTVEDIRIGGTPWWQYRGADVRVWTGYNNEPLQLFCNDHVNEQFQIELDNNWITRETLIDDAQEITLNINFPQGLIGFNDQGTALDSRAEFEIFLSKDGSWNHILSFPNYTSHGISFNQITGATQFRFYRPVGHNWAPNNGFNAGRPGTSWLGGGAGFVLETFTTYQYGGTPPKPLDPVVGSTFNLDGTIYTLTGLSFIKETYNYIYAGEVPTTVERVLQFNATFNPPLPDTGPRGDVWTWDEVNYFSRWIPFYGMGNTYSTVVNCALPQSGIWGLTRKVQDPFIFSITVTLPAPGRWSVSVRRADPIDYKNNEVSKTKILDQTMWTLLRSTRYAPALQMRTPHTVLELKVTATEQLSGLVDTITAYCSRYLNTWDGGIYEWKPSSNPAWIALEILMGPGNPDPIPWERISLQSFIDFAAFCNRTAPNGQPYHTFNCNWDSESTVAARLLEVLNSSRASLTIRNNQFAIIWENFPTVPSQLFTPMNSWGFKGTKTFTKQPHALKVGWIDPSSEWQLVENMVYADGYDQNNAAYFESLSLPYCTNWAEAWRNGRYYLAVGKLRPESFSLSCDVENLLCERGDFVRVQHDVAKAGGIPARVAQATLPAGQVRLTEPMPWNATDTFYIRFRRSDNSQVEVQVTGQVDDFTFKLAFDPGVLAGDLAVYGKVNYVTDDFLVKSVRPGTDLTAELTLIPISRAIGTSDVAAIPDYRPPISNNIGITAPDQVEWVRFDVKMLYRDRYPYVNAVIDWPPVKGAYEYEIWIAGLDFTNNYRLIDTVRIAGNFELFTMKSTLAPDYPKGALLNVKILPRSIFGKKVGMDAAVAYSFIAPYDNVAPGKPLFFSGNVTNFDTMHLKWLPPEDPDIAGYILRFIPDVNDPIWAKGTTEVNLISYNITSVNVNARIGSYMLKTIDTTGNISEEYASVRTTIPGLVNYNAVERVQEEPAWKGSGYQIVKDGTNIRVANESDVCTVLSYGYYNFYGMMDLGGVYDSRLTSEVLMFADECILVASWLVVADVNPVAATEEGSADVVVQIRTSSKITAYMAEWVPSMSVADPIGVFGTESDFSGWQTLTAATFTGRFFQFRAVLTSVDPRVTPVVTSLKASLDMPDRTVSEHDITIPAGGTRVEFPGGLFKEPPAVAYTFDDAGQGEHINVTHIDIDGFDVEIFDKDNISVGGQLDYMAKGFGELRPETLPAIPIEEQDDVSLLPAAMRRPTTSIILT